MSMFLFKLAQAFMRPMQMLGANEDNELMQQDWYKGVIQPIIDLMNQILVPLLILVGTAGSIYAVVLGVNYSKAEDAGKREEAKKRLINAVIGLVVMIALLLILWLFTQYASDIVDFIRGQ